MIIKKNINSYNVNNNNKTPFINLNVDNNYTNNNINQNTNDNTCTNNNIEQKIIIEIFSKTRNGKPNSAKRQQILKEDKFN